MAFSWSRIHPIADIEGETAGVIAAAAEIHETLHKDGCARFSRDISN
jgi:uncharacterized protein YqgV (UPF0045/DUF77 family)